MFTGIVEEVGEVIRIGNGQLVLGAGKVLEDVHLGDSIAVNGICLTVTDFSGGHFTADVMPETLRRTSLQELTKGSPVNLERALTLSSRLGGHIEKKGSKQVPDNKKDENSPRGKKGEHLVLAQTGG